MFSSYDWIEQITTQGENLEIVSLYVYLGKLAQAHPSLEKEIKRRIRLD